MVHILFATYSNPDKNVEYFPYSCKKQTNLCEVRESALKVSLAYPMLKPQLILR